MTIPWLDLLIVSTILTAVFVGGIFLYIKLPDIMVTIELALKSIKRRFRD